MNEGWRRFCPQDKSRVRKCILGDIAKYTVVLATKSAQSHETYARDVLSCFLFSFIHFDGLDNFEIHRPVRFGSEGENFPFLVCFCAIQHFCTRHCCKASWRQFHSCFAFVTRIRTPALSPIAATSGNVPAHNLYPITIVSSRLQFGFGRISPSSSDSNLSMFVA